MKVGIGIVFLVMGIGQILMRSRLAAANSASNRVLFGGPLGGPKVTAANTFGNGVAGLIAVGIGIALIVASVV